MSSFYIKIEKEQRKHSISSERDILFSHRCIFDIIFFFCFITEARKKCLISTISANFFASFFLFFEKSLKNDTLWMNGAFWILKSHFYSICISLGGKTFGICKVCVGFLLSSDAMKSTVNCRLGPGFCKFYHFLWFSRQSMSNFLHNRKIFGFFWILIFAFQLNFWNSIPMEHLYYIRDKAVRNSLSSF